MNTKWNLTNLPHGESTQVEAESEASIPQELEMSDQGSIPFPMDLLPPTARNMAKEIARVTTSGNESLAVLSVLGIASASLGGGIQMRSGGERITKGNLYILAVADSGTGKGEAFKIAAAPLVKFQAVMTDAFNKNTRPGLDAEIRILEKQIRSLTNKAASAAHEDLSALTESLQDAQKKLAAAQEKLKSTPTLVVSDTTKEALSIVLSSQPHEATASISSEARGVVSIIKGRYGKQGGDEDLYCSGYSGDTISVNRVGRGPLTLKNPCIALLWMVQPDILADALCDEALESSGFLARLLLVDSNAEPQLRDAEPEPIPGEVKSAWFSLIWGLLIRFRNNLSDPFEVKLEEGAKKHLHDYQEEAKVLRRSGGDHRDIPAYVARWAENATRLALVLHSITYGSKAADETLSLATAKSAVEIMRWFNKQQLRVLTPTRRERREKEVLSLLTVLTEAGGEMSVRDLGRSHSFKPDALKRLCAEFPDKIICEKRKKKTGRPSDVIRMLGLEDKSH